MLASLPDDQAARAAATHDERKRQEAVRNIVSSLPDSYFAEQGMTSANMEGFARGMQTAMEQRHVAHAQARAVRPCPQIVFRSSDPAHA